MANELAIETPERIWVDRLRGETEEGEWFITTDTDCEGEEGWTQYVRADTVGSLRAEVERLKAEKDDLHDGLSAERRDNDRLRAERAGINRVV